jgi:NADH:ubiquinone reductase (H+-translocating)
VATAGLAAEDIALPIRGILAAKPGLTVRMAGVAGVDLEKRSVRLDDDAELTYDHLLIALGVRPGYLGHPEWARFARGLKTLDDALEIRRRLLLAFERAETEDDPARRAGLMTVVVIGAGATGVELAGSIAVLARRVLRKDFDRIDAARARVVLVEGLPRVLENFPPDLSESARRQLEKLGVEVHTGERVESIRRDEVVLSGEVIRAATILWTAGVEAEPLAVSPGVPSGPGGRIAVRPDLSVPGHPEVFAVGDIVSLARGGKGGQVPAVAPAALQMGRHVARVLAAELPPGKKRAERPAFVYKDKGNLAVIGRSAAVADLGRVHLSGSPAWLIWLTVHLFFLAGMRNRLSVFTSWVHAFFTRQTRARVIFGAGRASPGAETEASKASNEA